MASTAGYSPGVYREQGGSALVIGTTGRLVHDVATGTTAASFSPSGVTRFGNAAAKQYTLSKPGRSGIVKRLVCTAGGSSAEQHVQMATGITISSTGDKNVKFTDPDQACTLVSATTALWDVVATYSRSTNIVSFSDT